MSDVYFLQYYQRLTSRSPYPYCLNDY